MTLIWLKLNWMACCCNTSISRSPELFASPNWSRSDQGTQRGTTAKRQIYPLYRSKTGNRLPIIGSGGFILAP
jgi:hypothetical protein